jgi:serine/threonine protein kinase
MPAPVVLERYRLHRRLGSGAYGTVWMANDERLERDVAVKIMQRERIVTGRFEREARAAARLSHPAIVTLYEASVDDDGAYLVSELVRGSGLDQLLAAGRLSDRDIVSIGIALCDALEHAHAQGVVHRDVKPSNVLVPERPVTPEQLAKLTDFGVAHVIGGDSLTLTGDVLGTPAYMAPEQAEGLAVDAAADLYSLALVLYEALTGVNPVGATTAAQRARRLGAHLPPLRRQRRDLPGELGQGIDRALRPRPRERGRICDLRDALEAGRDQVADTAGIVSGGWLRRTKTGLTAHGSGRPRTKSGLTAPGSDRTRKPADNDAARLEQHGAETEASQGALVESWPARGLAALAAGAVAVFISVHVLPSGPVPPALAAFAAVGMVLADPRAAWLALTLFASGIAAAQGHTGAALMTLFVLSLPVALLFRSPGDWPLPAGAPALGLIGLAGAWPALAARAATPWRRAALGGIGWVWLVVAIPVAGRALYLPIVAGAAPESAWAGSPATLAHRMLSPVLTSGALAPAIVWAVGAAVLPWLVHGRSAVTDIVRVGIWSVAMIVGCAIAVAAVNGSNPGPSVGGAALGAVLGAVIALAPSWLSGGRPRRRPGQDPTGSGGQFP